MGYEEFKGLRDFRLAVFINSISHSLKELGVGEDFLRIYKPRLDSQRQVPLPLGEEDWRYIELLDTAFCRSLLQEMDSEGEVQ